MYTHVLFYVCIGIGFVDLARVRMGIRVLKCVFAYEGVCLSLSDPVWLTGR